MKKDTSWMDWFLALYRATEQDDGFGLDDSELDLLAEWAETPELFDPVLFFLPGRRRREEEWR